MGSASEHARTTVTAALGEAGAVDLAVAAELFQAARAIAEHTHLSGALADSAAAPEARRKVIQDVFGAAFQPASISLLSTAVSQRWSSAADLADGLAELAVRAASVAAPDADLEGELFAFSRTVSDNPELELALNSRLGDQRAKGGLIDGLLGGRVSAATALVVSSLVQQPGERRIRRLLGWAMSIVADARGREVATVVSAAPLSAAQTTRLVEALTARAGRTVTINTVIDPALVGGVRVHIGDDVIDASVATRLAELRQRLAG